jgi:hypothetical protein
VLSVPISLAAILKRVSDFLRALYVPHLGALVSTDQEQDQIWTSLLEIEPVSRTIINAQLTDAAAHRSDIAKLSQLQAQSPRDDPILRAPLAQSLELLSELV